MFRQKYAPALLAGVLSISLPVALLANESDEGGVEKGIQAVTSAAKAAEETVESAVQKVDEAVATSASEETVTESVTEPVTETVEAKTDLANDANDQPAVSSEATEQAAEVKAKEGAEEVEEAGSTEAAPSDDNATESEEQAAPEAEEVSAGEPSENMPSETMESESMEGGQAAHDEASMMPQVPVMDVPDEETLANVFYAFRQRFPSLPLDDITPGPYPGWFEIISDARLVYVNEDVSLLFQGSIVDLNSGIDLSEARVAGLHMGLINNIGEEKMVVYKADPASDRNITVFTDINCGYCQLLHSQIEVLLDNGVNVRYLMFPRAGLESDSRDALESVWCSDNPQEAMTAAKAGEPVERALCGAPVEEHYEVAVKVGLRGTPLIYLDNGTSIPGYREAAALIQMIHSSEPMTN